MIKALVDKIKFQAISHPLVNMASVGDISLFDNKATIAYPYVNVDVVNCLRKDFLKTYTLRIYVCDRNEPYIAYNKTELILTEMLEQLNIFNLDIKYFNNDFQDVVNGVYVDVQFQVPIGCSAESIFDYSLLKDVFMISDNGDFVPIGYSAESIFDYSLPTDVFMILDNGDFITLENGEFIIQ